MNEYQLYGKIDPWATPAPIDFYNWLFFETTGKARQIWGLFFSLGLGFCLALYLTTSETVMLAVAALYALGLLCFMIPWSFTNAELQTKIAETPELIAPPPIPYGVIYVMRRSDGVYKIGKTHYLRNRLRSHRIDYGQGFDVVASWVVPNADSYERAALDLTRQYHFSEGKRKELRKMSEAELSRFILDFTERVYDGLKKTTQN